jgi:hypothetical protein
MDGRRRQRAGNEPRGFVPPERPGARRPWRRLLAWLVGDRDEIDQEGLLAERTLLLAPYRRRREDEERPAAERPGEEQ